MAEPSLIGGYLAELSAQLPAPIAAELADGLDQTHQRYLGQGLDPAPLPRPHWPSSASQGSSWPHTPAPAPPAAPPAGC
jgi:hypothetical protein